MKEVIRPQARENQIMVDDCKDNKIYAFKFEDTIQTLCVNSTPQRTYEWFILDRKWGGFSNPKVSLLEALKGIDPTTKIYQFDTQREYLEWAVNNV